jgi:hypothetical protein
MGEAEMEPEIGGLWALGKMDVGSKHRIVLVVERDVEDVGTKHKVADIFRIRSRPVFKKQFFFCV